MGHEMENKSHLRIQVDSAQQHAPTFRRSFANSNVSPHAPNVYKFDKKLVPRGNTKNSSKWGLTKSRFKKNMLSGSCPSSKPQFYTGLRLSIEVVKFYCHPILEKNY